MAGLGEQAQVAPPPGQAPLVSDLGAGAPLRDFGLGAQVLAHLRSRPTPKPPTAVEIRDGQVYRWTR